MTYQQEIELAQAAVAKLQTELAENTKALVEMTESLLKQKAEIEKITGELSVTKGERDEAQAEVKNLREQVASLALEVVDFEGQVAQTAQDQLAAVGHDPIPAAPSLEQSHTSDAEAMVAELARLQKEDPARATVFLRENKDALRKAWRK